MTVTSIQFHSDTIASDSDTVAITLSGSPTLAKCVVWPMGYAGGEHFLSVTQVDGFVDTDGIVSQDDLIIRRDTQGVALTASAHVVEFDSSVNVYRIEYNYGSSTTGDVSYAIDSSVDATKAFAFAGHYCDSNTGFFDVHNVRLRLTDSSGDPSANPTHVTISRTATAGTLDGHIYVMESDDFFVQEFTIDANGSSSSTHDLTTTVDSSKTFLMGSWQGGATAFRNDRSTCDVYLEDVGAGAETVTLDIVNSTNTVNYTGFAVELTGSTVTHGVISSGTAETVHDVTVDVDSSIALPIVSGNDGTTTCGSFTSPSNVKSDVQDASMTLELTSDTNLRLSKPNDGGEIDYDIHWSIIEWDTGEAPPVTRRVMVIS